MTTYQISNTTSGVIIGTYEAESRQGALEAMARDQGYSDYAECNRVSAGDFASDEDIDRAHNELDVHPL